MANKETYLEDFFLDPEPKRITTFMHTSSIVTSWTWIPECYLNQPPWFTYKLDSIYLISFYMQLLWEFIDKMMSVVWYVKI